MVYCFEENHNDYYSLIDLLSNNDIQFETKSGSHWYIDITDQIKNLPILSLIILKYEDFAIPVDYFQRLQQYGVIV